MCTLGNCCPTGGQIHNYFDDVAIVNYPWYYCNGFQAHNRGEGRPRCSQAAKILCAHIFSSQNLMHCQVESYSGFRLHERPRRFTWGETWMEIDRIMAQWITPASLCFKVRAGKRVYRLEYCQIQDVWDVEPIRPA